jgi:predicted ATPase/DNA-binding SARP family transcriptional activator
MVETNLVQWKLYLFGPSRLEHSGQPLAINLRKALALFVYLAVTRQPHSRDALATLFWPEKDQQSARANLRRTLYDLNQLLDGQLLAIEPETVALLDHAPLWLDTEHFQQILADHLPEDGLEVRDPNALSPLIEAAAIYTDDFLAGFTLPDCPAFDDWQFFQREELRNGYAELLQQLVMVHVTKGQLGDAMHYARRWLLLDPLEETVHRQLMRLYAQSGQLAAALRQYDECVRILDEELGVPPDEETTTLYEAIRTKRFPPPGQGANRLGNRASRETGDNESESNDALALSPPLLAAPLPDPPGTIPHNLPTKTTPFIGRAQELADLLRRLTDPACRLLTLIGPGGIGKTRLALEAAQTLLDGDEDAPSAVEETTPRSKEGAEHRPSSTLHCRFNDGIFFVNLQPVTTPSGLIAAIAEATGFRFYSAVPPHQQLMNFLREKQMLLVLDNFEHLLEGVAVVSELLMTAPQLKLLVTSREALNLHEEWFHPLAGMMLPAFEDKQGAPPATSDETLPDAVQLFVQSARRARPDFALAPERAHVVRICRLVDGFPLALELAAAWLKVLSCQKIADEIAHNLDILTTRHQNIPTRHRSMRAVLEQAWQLLTDEEQQVLRRLAVFEGGFSQEAARAVAGASLMTLATLTEKALVYVTPNPSVRNRYQMHELLRQFGAAKLAASSQEENTIRTEHSAYYLRFLKRYAPLLTGAEQQAALQEISVEIENVRAGWSWAVTQLVVDPSPAIALDEALTPLYDFYQIQSRYLEGKDLFVQTAQPFTAAGMAAPAAPTARLHMRVLARCGAFCHFLCEYEMAEQYLQSALPLAQELNQPAELAFVHNFLGQLAMWRGEKALAKEHLSTSLTLSRTIDDQAGMASALEKLANLVDATLGEYVESQQLARQTLQISRTLGRPDWTAYALDTLGFVTFCLGEYADAEAYYCESLALFETIGDRYGIAMALGGLGLAYWGMGGEKLAEATAHFQQSLLICRTIGHQGQVAGRLAGLARIANDQGDYAQAQQLAQEGLAIARELGSPVYLAHMLNALGEAAYALGDLPTARVYLREALQVSSTTGLFAHLAIVLFHYAMLLVAEGEITAARSSQKLAQAVTIFTVVQAHPATWQIYKVRAAQQAATLQSLGAATATATSSLQAVVAEILRE